MNTLRLVQMVGLGCVLVVSMVGCGTPEVAVEKEKVALPQTSALFAKLPDYCPTPDGMAIAPNGNLVVACPNYGDQTKAACLIEIDKAGKVSKLVDVPVLKKTGLACPMGVEFGPDGDVYICDNQGWSGTKKGKEEGRILRLRIRNNEVAKTTVVVSGMEHPNGIRVRNGKLFVTQSMMPKVRDRSGLLTSAVYCFPADGENIKVTNTLKDKYIITTMLTLNKDCQYGADGLVFDKAGNLYIGNFGDGALHKITFKDGKVASNTVWAKDIPNMRTTDGICIDSKGNIYVADFSENAVAVVSPDAKVTRIAQSPDCDGSKGGLDQPGEPIVWNGKLIVTCFDKVTGPDKVNTGHDKPYTICELKLVK